jgi:hypothetical protein
MHARVAASTPNYSFSDSFPLGISMNRGSASH